MIQDSRIILGIDPGYGRVGYGLVRKEGSSLSYITAGCIETEKTKSPSERLQAIYTQLTALIATEPPHVLALEQLFFAKNAKTALRVAETRGILLLFGEEHNIPMREFTPLQVKVATCGYGKADKAQVQNMIMRIFNLTSLPKPDDVADALAIALTAAYTRDTTLDL
ncbi:MAG: crossover junction endodeoxyribonuclease RuvC [Candidatus Ryanbacteria bacterium RIFCSPHIGHO2_02_FULL_45_17b]|uniref:Crossover junction endodeoxyribonuclease RuvC n=1 Tax=Candidatus Ryanbacteria bacterium RIFCSPHIGHO2_01_FULL_45_22 TaxID=1802114 RepID=A0A1G2G1Y2_9BACT|nr:MAG: crossover junction endodeoxyribonuclease RuvC [Candidatus Ryanbacteria bacterium RIFCSPHIGHO2_01_FULL_45_22]OGZ47504.1 MAG: crossover junction endodeoxyribonuclease RuvC [Candidatus Ryanbacteria bacterium RIFCSPHIGHO2_02_FULL_45_17b]